MIPIRIKKRDTAFALAFEEYLLALAGDDDFFVLWRDAPAVVVGRFQNVFRETDVPLALSLGVPVFRRISGGGAVYHDAGNLNYTFISNRDDGADGARFTEPVAAALRSLGVPAETDGSDITVGGVKISGSARANTARRTLHHGTLLFDTDLDALAALTSDVRSDAFSGGGIASRKTTPRNVRPLVPSSVTADGFADLIGKAVSGSSGFLTEDDFDADAIRRGAEKYGSAEWTYGENPKFSFRATLDGDGGKIAVSYSSRRGIIDGIDSSDARIASLAGVSLAPGSVSAALVRAGEAEDRAARAEAFLLTGR